MESKMIYQISKIMTVTNGRLCSDGTEPAKTEYEFCLSKIPNIKMTLQCCVLSVGRYTFSDSFNLNGSDNNFFSLILVNSGCLSADIRGKVFSVGENGLIFISDLEQYSLRHTGNGLLDITVLRCSGILPEAHYELMTRRVISGTDEDARKINESAEKIYTFTGFGNDYGIALISDTVSSMLIGIYSKNNRFIEADRVFEMPKWLSSVIEYSKNNLGNGISAKDMQAVSGKSASDFYGEFKKYTGMTPLNYLLSLRLERARTLLLTTDLQIKYISYVVGINSVNHFIEHFREKFGETPYEYRSRMTDVSGQ